MRELLAVLAVLLVMPGNVWSSRCHNKTVISVCPHPVVVEQGQPFDFTVTCMWGSIQDASQYLSITVNRCVAKCKSLAQAYLTSSHSEPDYDPRIAQSIRRRTTLSRSRTTMSMAFQSALFGDLSYVYQCDVRYMKHGAGSSKTTDNTSIAVVPHPGRSMEMEITPIKNNYLPSDSVSLSCRAVSAFNSSRPEDQAVMHFEYLQQSSGSWCTVSGTVTPKDQTTDGYFTSTTYVITLTRALATGCMTRFRCYVSHGNTALTSHAAHRNTTMTPGAGDCPFPGEDDYGSDGEQRPPGNPPDPGREQTPVRVGSSVDTLLNDNSNSGAPSASNTGLWVGVAVAASLLVLLILGAALTYAIRWRRGRRHRHGRGTPAAAAGEGRVVRIVLDPASQASHTSAFSDTSSVSQSAYEQDPYSRGELDSSYSHVDDRSYRIRL